MNKKLPLLLLGVLFVSLIQAQIQKPVYLSQAVASGSVKGYYEYLPSDYSSSGKNYPLIIWVHGSGQGGQGNTTDLPRVLEFGLPKMVKESGFPASFASGGINFSFIVISPQFTTGWPTGTMLNGMITFLVNTYRIDPDRIYLLGMSAGGGTVWDCASMNATNSNRIAAIIPFCGAFAPTQARANIIASGKLPVWAFHNTNDGTVPVQQSRNWVNYINAYTPAYSPAAKLTEFPIVSNNAVIAHDSWSAVLPPTYKPAGLNIYEWLLQYKRRTVTSNVIPLANAGADQGIILPASLLLDGSGSTDPDGVIVSYNWTKVSGPSSYTFADSTVMKPTVTNLVEGIYQFKLTVKDNLNATSTDNVIVNVYPEVPAGAQQRILIDAGLSSANGGVITTSPNLNGYTWNNMTSGLPGIRLNNAVTITNSPTPIGIEVINRLDGTFSPGSTGMGNGNTSIVVNDYPGSATTDHALVHSSATNGKWRIFGLDITKVYSVKFWGARTNTTASRSIEIKRSDDNIWLTYNATNNSNYNNAAVFNISGKTEMTFDIRTKSGSDFSCINIIDIKFGGDYSPENPAPNEPPVANAGSDLTYNLPTDSVTLNGCFSSDPENAPLAFQWTKVSGPQATIVTPAICNPKVRNLIAGTYTFELTVKDSGNIIRKDSVIVIIKDILPTPWPPAVAPACNQPYKIVVVGSSSAYGTGADPIDSSWVSKFRMYVQQQNPLNTVVNLATLGLTSYEVLQTGFIPPSNRPSPNPDRNITKALSLNPSAIIINLPSNDIALGYTLDECYTNFNRLAAAADARNIPVWITTTQPRDRLSPNEKNMQMTLRDWILQRFGSKAVDFWTTVGNTNGSMNPVYSAGDSVHQNNYGHHIFFTRMVAENIWDTLCMRLNMPPVAVAGNDQVLQLPANRAFLNGRASTDQNGTITSYQWMIISGPGGANLNSPTTDTTSVYFTNAGTYVLRLTVTDNDTLTGSDDISITVKPINQIPISQSGPDQTIQLPANSVLLNGRTSSDPDGTITNYQWAFLSGPAGVQILNPTKDTSTVRVTNAGSYTIRLTVTDNNGASAYDDVLITVQPQVQNPPPPPPPPPTGSGKTIRVNIYGGSNPYPDAAWNNWNTSPGVYSSNFKYEDGTASTLNAIINTQAGIADNGANYAANATACPGQVLRYNSFNTSIRTLKFRGLDPSRTYYLEFYGSRINTGNKTVVNIGNINDTINTDNNTSDFALFNNVVPESTGNLTVNLSRIGTYNYLAGFILTENSALARGTTTPDYILPVQGDNSLTNSTLPLVFPNPFSEMIRFTKPAEPGSYSITISDVFGKILIRKKVDTWSDKPEMINTSGLAKGLYIFSLSSKNQTYTQKIIKN